MKLVELEIKNFGKLQDRRIKLGDGICLIYGENESGKTTVHTFIQAMLFGLERGRGRAAAKDTFSRYEPWENGNYYAGTLRFQCGGKVFALRRNFDRYSRGAVLVCETDGEELSVADGDLDMLLDGLTAGSYENTLYIGQLRGATSQALAAELKNYATNSYVAGDSDMDLAAAREELLAEKKRTDQAIKTAAYEKQRRRETAEQEASYVWRDVHRIDTELQEASQELKLRQAEKERAGGYGDGEWRKTRITDLIRPAKWRVHPVEVAVIVLLIAAIFLLIPPPFNSFVTVVAALLGAIYIWNRMKIGKKKAEDWPGQELSSTDKLAWKLEHLKGERLEKQIEYENLQEQIREFDEIEESRRELETRREALLLAVRRLEEVSLDMQKNLTGRLNRRTSEILAQITGGRYEKFAADGDLQMSLFDQGRRVELWQVSQGTLEQIYFAFRMAAGEVLYRENCPVILDDAFAFYDDARLERTLRWLARCGRQVILFSCQSREEEIMKRNGIHYEKTVL